MPGKQDPDYFPLNLNNMNGGLGFYGEVGPSILIPHRHPGGKFDGNVVVHHGSPIAMALHNSPVNATFLSDNLMSEYINMNVNTLPIVNSEDEGEDDDVVSQSGSESVSVQGSDLDLDVEVMDDDVDSLVLNIRDKLRMAAPHHHHQYRTSHSANDYCWTDSPSATSTPNSIHSTTSNTDNDLLILPQQRSSSTSSTSKNNGGSGGGQRKRRPSMNRSWRHSHPNANNSYYRQFHQHHQGSISKSKKSTPYQNQWWSSRSFGDLSKQSRSKEAYHLLQELLQSGTLIQEAVRRLNRKCLNSSNSGNTSSGSNNPSSNAVGGSSNIIINQQTDPNIIIPPNNSSANLVVSTSKYSYSSMEEDSDSTAFHQHHNPSSVPPCN